jgi:hypothetical protein
VTRGWIKLVNGELHDLFSSAYIIVLFESRRMRWTGHVGLMGG